jgi:hypothetical protein
VIGEKFFETIDAISRAEPRLGNWSTSDEPTGANPYRIEPHRRNPGALISRHPGFEDHIGQDGYWICAYADRDECASNERAFLILKAASSYRDRAHFELGSERHPPNPAVVTFGLYKAVLLAMIRIWPAPWANAQCANWGEELPTLPGDPPFLYSGYGLPWISYLCAERAAKVDVPTGVKTERTPDGGLLMIATEERFDYTNPEHMRPSRLMAEIMIEHGGDPGY